MPTDGDTISIADQIGMKITLNFPPKRIVSLVPSQTELLFYLGLEHEVVGVTKFCIHPKIKTSHKLRIGGTKNFNFEKIASLKPDLILGNKEENYKEGIEELSRNYPVYTSDIATLNDAFKMIADIGVVVGKSDEAKALKRQLEKNFAELRIRKKRRALYLIWKKPYMSIGGDTFIDEMLSFAGFENVLKNKSRYPVISEEEIVSVNPDYVLLSSEPYPFKEKHINEFKLLLPESTIVIVDGEMFSWFGSRLIYATDYFQQLSHL